tara:strand:+ start:1856 stop:9493 length:7638 start_codon:yes stop_codon:yes gene_type:complete
MADVKYITFEGGAPRLEVPLDFSDEQVRSYLKSEQFEQQMFGSGYAFKYGLDPVNLLEEHNLDDNAFVAGAASSMDTLKQIGQGALATMYDIFGAEEKQAEAINLVKQYQLDQQAHMWRQDADGEIKQRISSLEQVFESDQEFSAFVEWLGAKVGEGAVTSVPFVLAGIVSGGVGAGAIGAGLVAKQVGMSAIKQSFTQGLLGNAAGGFAARQIASATSLSGLGLMATAYGFGAGDTYVNQLAETDDPNAAIALAAGIPYAAAEGAFGAGANLLRILVDKAGAAKVAAGINLSKLKKGEVVEIVKDLKKATTPQRLGAFGKGLLASSTGEAVAESIQETVTSTGQEIEGGRSLAELYSSKDFWKQIGEATAAGFAGGGPFGVVGGTVQAMRVGPSMDITINGKVQNFQPDININADAADDPTTWENLDYTVGDTVTYTGAPQQETNTNGVNGENFSQPNANDNATPTFIVKGSTEFNNKKYIALVDTNGRRDMFVPVADANKILNLGLKSKPEVDDIFDGGEVGNVNLNLENTTEQLKINEDIIKSRGYNIKDTSVGLNNESKKKWINDTEADIQRQLRARDKDRTKKIDPQYKQYEDNFGTSDLRKQITKEWKQEKFKRARNKAVNLTNNLSLTDTKTLTDLQYFNSSDGKNFIDTLLGKSKAPNNVSGTPTNMNTGEIMNTNEWYLSSDLKKDPVPSRTRGKKQLDDIIKKKIPYSNKNVRDMLGIMESTKQKTKKEIPLEVVDQETIGEFRSSLLGEGLYKMTVVERINATNSLLLELDTVMSLPYKVKLDNATIKQLKKEIKKANSVGLETKYLAQEKILANFVGNTYLISNESGVMGSLSENARLAMDIKLNQLQSKKRKNAVDLQLIENYTQHLNNIQIKRESLNKLLTSFNKEPITTNKGWNSLNGAKLIKELKDLNAKYTATNEPSPVYYAWQKAAQQSSFIKPRLTSEFATNSPQVLQTLKELIAGLNLNMQINVLPYIEHENNLLAARYINGSKTIEVAFNGLAQLQRTKYNPQTREQESLVEPADNYKFLLYHEVMHALRDEGFFKQHEWRALTASGKKWIKKYKIAERYSDLDYEAQVEEAISEAFADYMTGRTVTSGPVAQAFERLKQYLLALANALTKNNFNTTASIFNQIDLGIVGQRYASLQRESIISTGGINSTGIVVNQPWSGTSALGAGQNLIPATRVWFAKQPNISNLKNFYKWFNSEGQSSSVVDSNNAPLVVMHTTKTYKKGEPFDAFDMNRSADFGMHFTATQRHISYIQQYNPLDIGQSYFTFNGFLNIKNPYRMPDLIRKDGRSWIPEEVIQVLFDDGVVTREQGQKLLNDNPPKETELEEAIMVSDSDFYQAVVKLLEDNGYDGIVYKNIGEDLLAQRAARRPAGETPINAQDVIDENNNPAEDSWIAFKPNQFKSVTNVGGYDMSQPSMRASRQWQSTETSGGWKWDNYMPQNRQQARDNARRFDKANEGVEGTTEQRANFNGPALSWFSKWVGAIREWAKDNMQMAKLFTILQAKEYFARQLQAGFTNKLARYRALIDSDPAIALAIRKAQAISQALQGLDEGTKFFMDSNGQIIFRAPMDYKGGPAELDIKPGEIVILEGDAAQAFLDYDKVMDEAVSEIRKGMIAGGYMEPLREALVLIKKFYGDQLPLSSDLIEELTYQDLKSIVTSLRDIASTVEYQNDPSVPISSAIQNLGVPAGDLTKKEIKRIRALIGFDENGKVDLKSKKGLGRLLAELKKYDDWSKGTYIPLMRFGKYFVKVTNNNVPKEVNSEKGASGAYLKEGSRTQYVITNPEYLLDYQLFETKREAEAAIEGLKTRYQINENATVSTAQKNNIAELKKAVKEKAMGLDGIGAFLSESSAETFKQLEEELKTVIFENRDLVGFDTFLTPRQRVGGVPGYSADFGRAASQFIFMASRAAANNRYMNEATREKDKVLSDAQVKTPERPDGDPHLADGVEKYWKYVNDPKQEFALFRQIGFWWYLGGNMSSAVLQVMSNVQFAGPMIAEITGGNFALRGAKAAGQLAKAQADAIKMLTVSNNQFTDTFIDWTKAPPDLIDFIMQDMAGYLKQGQALHEAGQVPGTENFGSRKRRAIRQFENAIIGGMFNTMEATSRLTSYMATMRTMMNDDGTTNNESMERARTLFEGDQLFQQAVDNNGGVITPQIVARHVIDDAFGVYSKLNRSAIMRNYGALPALFQSYISQMFALMNRMLMKGRTPGQRSAGRRVFARQMLMIVLTGGLFGIPGSDDIETLASWMMNNVPGVDSGLATDMRAELREMLYNAGIGANLVNAMENGFLEAYLNIDVQRRLSLGNFPGSQQVRAIASMMGLSNGGSAADFAGAPGSVFMTPFKEAKTALREGRGIVDVAFKSAPLFIRNGYKAYQQSIGQGFVETNYGTVLRDDVGIMESVAQLMGFGSAKTKRAREAAYMERFYETSGNKKKQRMNAQITNAIRDILIGNKNRDSSLTLSGQEKINDLTRDLYAWNSEQLPEDMIFIDMDRLWDQALLSVNPGFRSSQMKPSARAKMKKFNEMYDF